MLYDVCFSVVLVVFANFRELPFTYKHRQNQSLQCLPHLFYPSSRQWDKKTFPWSLNYFLSFYKSGINGLFKVTTNYYVLNFLTVRNIPGMNTCQFKGFNYHSITDDNTEKHGKYLYQRNKNFYKTKAVSDET